MPEAGADHPLVPVDPDVPAADRRPRPGVLAAIALGGSLGAPARYEMSRLVHVAKDGFPWATFWTNVSGSLVLGFLLVLVIERFPPGRYLRAFAATGFLGAYTTFSTFMVESDLLVKDGHGGVAALYVVGSTVGGFGGAWLGIAAARAVVPEQRTATL